VLSLNAVAYYGAVYKLLTVDYHAYLGLFTVALGGLYVALGVELWRQAPAERRDERPVLLTLGVALTLITLAAPIQFTAYRITIGWAVEAAALALTVARGAIPPTIHHGETDDDCAIDVVANQAREQRVRCAVSTSLGFGGNDSAIVMRAL